MYNVRMFLIAKYNWEPFNLQILTLIWNNFLLENSFPFWKFVDTKLHENAIILTQYHNYSAETSQNQNKTLIPFQPFPLMIFSVHLV